MANRHTVEKQLKHIKFNLHAWGRGEAQELPNILLDDEKIFECVNGIYDGGFALLVATDIRMLLVDKKPLNYLTVEDLRFDMINEIDYSHRLFGAHITVSTGNKMLRFRSYNQQRLRKLINHVQHRMAEIKKEQAHHQEDQKEHLQQINQQLQSYLLSQYQQQLNFQEQLRVAREQGKNSPVPEPEPVKPSPELSDFLFAQSLLKQYDKTGQAADTSAASNADTQEALPAAEPIAAIPAHVTTEEPATTQAFSQAPRVEKTAVPPLMADLYAEGMHEIFGRDGDDSSHHTPHQPNAPASGAQSAASATIPQGQNPVLVINPLRIAYSKLPMALRNRKFGRPSFHAHSQAHAAAAAAAAAAQQQAQAAAGAQ